MMTCPYCLHNTSRVKRKTSDRLLDIATLGIFGVKRFKCFYCFWEGRVTRFTKEMVYSKR